MSLKEKAAYLKGLADGLNLDKDKDINKMIAAIVDAIDEIASTVDEIDEDLYEFTDQLDAVDEDLSTLEEYVYNDDYDFDGDYDEEGFYEVECPECHEIITIDEGILDDGYIACPNCGADLEFDADADDFDIEEE